MAWIKMILRKILFLPDYNCKVVNGTALWAFAEWDGNFKFNINESKEMIESGIRNHLLGSHCDRGMDFKVNSIKNTYRKEAPKKGTYIVISVNKTQSYEW